MMEDYGANQQRLLDAFFHEQDKKLLDQLKASLDRKAAKARLAELSRITDDAVLDRLVDLNIGPDTLAALELAPLIYVAWADRKMDARERQAILKAAESVGVVGRDDLRSLLESWLQKPPGRQLLEAWKQYIAALSPQLTAEERQRIESFVVGHARSVAEAAGGFLGLGAKVSPQEQRILDELQQAFRV